MFFRKNLLRLLLLATCITSTVGLPLVSSLSIQAAIKSSVTETKANKDIIGPLEAVKDGDTYLVRQGNTVYTIRLHWADCPEIAHNSKQVNQLYGIAARDYMIKQHLGHIVTVHRVSLSYGRIVGDVKDGTTDFAVELVSLGYAEVDNRYKPSEILIACQAVAKKLHNGIWASPDHVSPKEWRDNGYKPKTTH